MTVYLQGKCLQEHMLNMLEQWSHSSARGLHPCTLCLGPVVRLAGRRGARRGRQHQGAGAGVEEHPERLRRVPDRDLAPVLHLGKMLEDQFGSRVQ